MCSGRAYPGKMMLEWRRIRSYFVLLRLDTRSNIKCIIDVSGVGDRARTAVGRLIGGHLYVATV
jgi:hypothetical protein